MTDYQKRWLRNHFDAWEHQDIEWLHHDDCIGATAEAHVIATEAGILIHKHPPINDTKRAFMTAPSMIVEMPEEYLVRNRAIVRATEYLIAMPAHHNEVQRSGTWATIRSARRQGKMIYIIDPGGLLTIEHAR
jgi:hypothetical protein